MKLNWTKWLCYAAVLFLVNSAASTLFFRIDLTRNSIHSLSEASIAVVSKLEEPLTIKAFLSENLPTPYNNLEQEISDLLEAYSLKGNKFFNYSIHIISSEGGEESEASLNSRTEAQNYGIFPIQIQRVEADEVKLVNAFMGMVFIQGDAIETIPVLGAGENREITVTSTIQRMSDKTSAILALENNVPIRLYYSDALGEVNASLASYPEEVAREIETLNRRYYGRLDFRTINPDNLAAGDKAPEEYNIPALNLQSGTRENPVNRKVYAGIVIGSGDAARSISLFRRNFFGGFDIEDTAALSESLPGVIDALAGVNPKIGFVSDHGSLTQYSGAQNPNEPGMNNFRSLLENSYDITEVTLSEGISEDISTLLLVSPENGFTEWELFQLDQYLMKGRSIAFFIDATTMIKPSRSYQSYQQPPSYLPRNTGLEPLLEHYGFTVETSYILDENCYAATDQDQSGGLEEIKYYFAPFIERDDIDKNSVIMGNIKRLLLLNSSPITINAEAASGTAPQVLFTSSPNAWEMRDQINLYDPTSIYPPGNDERLALNGAAYAAGPMTSYFKDKAVPSPPPPEEGESDEADTSTFKSDQADAETAKRASGNGKIFVIGSSALLKDNILDPEGTSGNAAFVLNLIDTLSGREDYARMRSKGQTYSPLKETSVAVKRIVKGFNIAGLPIIVILCGILVWLRGLSRRKYIETLFSKETQ
ncbi:MAG: hypothetical protein B0D92_02935 [Spirochaeta sp. LUC14_002_19_P3]|nr:MAG: hypothetical protein B0D92_02935 [Spirochaeta sp. LUC14_002_19_P3]